MRTRRINFDEVAIKGRRYWIDDEGKRHQQTQKFWQTINPFNKLPDGTIKDRAAIMAELIAERDAWMAEKVTP